MSGACFTAELDAQARHELWYDLMIFMDDDALGGAFRLLSGVGDATTAAALRQGAMRVMDAAAILEQIGWTESDDRKTFTVNLTGAFAEWWVPQAERYLGDQKHDHGPSDEHVIQTGRLLSIIGDAVGDGRISQAGARIVQIDRATRDVIVAALRHDFAESTLNEATLAARIFDSVGWLELGDRESYTLPLSDEFLAWLESMMRFYDENVDSMVWSRAFEPRRIAMVRAMRKVLDLATVGGAR